MTSALLLITLILASNCLTVDLNTQNLIDSGGNKYFFHGVNVIQKNFPYYPDYETNQTSSNSLNAQDFELLQDLGFNFIRLYVSWQATESVKGTYNYTYLQQVKNIVQLAKKYNIQILLDAHQDLLSRFFCGEGFPDWAITKKDLFPNPQPYFNIQFDSEGYPNITDCMKNPFPNYYQTYGVQQAFKDLYNNENGIADSFANFWGAVAYFFKNESNVLGYEIINEPIQADKYKNLYEYFFPSVGDNKNLLTLYRKVSQAIRKYDNQKLVFFEPAVYDTYGGFFQDSPGGVQFRENEIYSYHIYCQYINNETSLYNRLNCKRKDHALFKRRESAAQTLNIGRFMTEFGAEDNSVFGTEEIDFVVHLANSKFVSWAYWQFKWYGDFTTQTVPGIEESLFDEQGQLLQPKTKILTHPYVMRMCGNPQQQSYSSNYYILTFNPQNNCGSNTLVYLNQEFYFDTQLNYKCTCACKLNYIRKSYYEVTFDDSCYWNQVTLTVFA